MNRITHNLSPEALNAPLTLYFAKADPERTDLHLQFATVADFIEYLAESHTGWWRVSIDKSGRLVASMEVYGGACDYFSAYTVFRELPRPRPNPSYPGAAFA